MSATAVPALSETDGPDPHGQAALLLVESLIHGLIGRRVLSVQDAVDIVEVALDAQIAMAEVGRSLALTTDLLEGMLRSLEVDLPRQ
jgi:hypothetical protein